jgi:hypothetical protein
VICRTNKDGWGEEHGLPRTALKVNSKEEVWIYVGGSQGRVRNQLAVGGSLRRYIPGPKYRKYKYRGSRMGRL